MDTSTCTSTSTPTYSVCVLGAGMVGCSIAHSLSRQHSTSSSPLPLSIALVDPAPPLSLTSSLSTGGFRSFYPADHTMTALASRSILILQALFQESLTTQPNKSFEFTRAGYLLCSKDKENWKMYKAVAQASENVGGGPLRFHHSFDAFSADSYASQTHGFDIITDSQIIQSLFPSLNHEIQAVCHIRNAGYLNVARLGKFLLEKSINNGVNLITAKALDITYSESDKTYTIKLSNGESITSKSIVLALGPHIIDFMKDVFNVDIPLFNEVHGKTLYTFPSPSPSIPETLAAPSLPMPIPPATPIIPFTLYTDSVPSLFFSDSEKQILRQNGLEWLVNLNEPRPHCRGLTRGEREDLEKQGETAPHLTGIWTYTVPPTSSPLPSKPTCSIDSSLPTPIPPPLYGTTVFRGLCHLFPQFKQYLPSTDKVQPTNLTELEQLNALNGVKVVEKAGYYTKTLENLPLIGSLEFLEPNHSIPDHSIPTWPQKLMTAIHQMRAQHSHSTSSPPPTKQSTTTHKKPMNWTNIILASGLSGLGIMASQSTAELVTLYVCHLLGIPFTPITPFQGTEFCDVHLKRGGTETVKVPGYARGLRCERYKDEAYLSSVVDGGQSGNGQM